MTLEKVIAALLPTFLVGIAIFLPFSIAMQQLCLGCALFLWLIKLITYYQSDLLVTPITLPFILWVGAVFIAAIFGCNPIASIQGMEEEWLFFGFLVVWGGTASQRNWKLILVMLIVATSLSALYSFYQHFTGLDPISGMQLMPMISGFRTHSTMNGYLTAGAIFGLIAAFVLPHALAFSGWRRYLFAVGTALAFAGSTLTYSRSAILGAIAALGVYFLFLLRRFRWATFLVPLVTIIVIGLVQPDVLYRFSKENPSSPDTKEYLHGSDIRIKIWGAAWQMFKDYPITGVGHGCFLTYYDKYRLENRYPTQGHAHSDILNIAASMGVIGLSAYLFIFFWLGRKLVKCYRSANSDDLRITAVAGLAVMASFLSMALFEAFFMDEETRLTLLFLLGLTFIRLRLLEKRQDRNATELFP
jgi:O-antigen ligase